jgi:acetoin utilization protein AcuC
MTLFIVYSDELLKWLLGPGDGSHPTNPRRAEIATEILKSELGEQVTVIPPTAEAKDDEDLEALLRTHDLGYVSKIFNGISDQWDDVRADLGEIAFKMFQGTIRAVELIVSGAAKVVFSPQGAKHHAKYDRDSGFCVFNDMVYAARELQKLGLKPLYLDWDIHAGDGVAEMLRGSGIPRISIHNGRIFPSDYAFRTDFGAIHDEADDCYNFCVRNGDGDTEFMHFIDEAGKIIDHYQPDVILLAAGPDGHTGANLIGVDSNYTKDGFKYAAEMVADKAIRYSQGRVLIGGAGGYQPLKETPETWALVVKTIFEKVKEGMLVNG